MHGILKMLTAGLRAGVVFVFVAVSLPATALADSAPALWKATRGESTVYIFGTIHLLTEDVKWLSPRLRQHFDEADTLVLEINMDPAAQQAIGMLMFQIGFYRPPDNLQNHLSEEEYRKIIDLVVDGQVPEAVVRQMRPWAAMITAVAKSAATGNFNPELGADRTFDRMARASGKTIEGLETVEYQLRLFADLPEDEQIYLLKESLKQIEDIEEVFIRMRDAWLDGDVEELADIMNEGMDGNDDLMERFLIQRNRNWVAQVDAMLDSPGVTFMAVGAGHLAGDDNLIELLEDEGIDVERQ